MKILIPKSRGTACVLLSFLLLAGRAFAETSYEALEKALRDPVLSKDAKALQEKIDRYHDDALKINQEKDKKTGNLRRVIYLLSTNPKKTQEFVKNFDRYGIEVFRAPVSDNPDYLRSVLNLKRQKGAEKVIVLALMKEQNTIYDAKTRIQLEYPRDFGRKRSVINFSDLTVHFLEEGRLVSEHYPASSRGKILPEKKAQDPEIFGWDDLFVLPHLRENLSYYELSKLDRKVSPRDMTISQYIKEHIYYRDFEDLNFHPVKQKQVVDFEQFVSDFVARVEKYNLPKVQEYGITPLFHSVINEGIFFRSPINRREKNYWLPGLNAGIPYTKKKDEIHELTYLAHDLGHFAIRDLIFTGKSSPLHRQVYITYRMMSEAVTMVFADMLFIDALEKSGIQYNYDERAIYPLFRDTGLSFTDPTQRLDSLIQLIRANVAYVLRGDDTLYRALLDQNHKTYSSLEAFKKKFKPFFIEDFRWTNRNYDNMVSRSKEISQWWENIKSFESIGNLHFETIDDLINKMDKNQNREVVDRVLDVVLQELVVPLFTNPRQLASKEEQLRKAFVRYMAGQFGVFAQFEPLLPETEVYRTRTLQALQEIAPQISLEGIKKVRKIYNEYIDVLLRTSLISEDDAKTYKQIYPLFEPFFVSYDQQSVGAQDLGAISRGILYRDVTE